MNEHTSTHDALVQENERLRERVAALEAEEDARRESEQRYRIINQTISDYAFSFHRQADGTFVLDWLTESFTKLTGYPVSDLLGKPNPFQTYIHPDDLDHVVQTLAAMQPDAPVAYEFRMVTKAGEVRWLSSSTRAACDETGQIVGFSGAARDITARKEAEESLRQEKDFSEQVVNTAHAIILVLDMEGRIVRFNPYLEQIAGYRLDEVQGADWFMTFLPERSRHTTKEFFLQSIHKVQAQGNVDTIVTKEGQERQIEWYDTLLKDALGQPLGLLAVGQDITERQRAEEQVRRDEAWQRSLLQTTQDAFISINRQGRIGRFNPAAERIFGYTAAEVVGQHVTRLMPEPYVSEHNGYIERYERTREPHAIGQIRSVAAKRKNGEVFPIELSVTEVAADGDTRYGAFIRDISEKVRLQERMVDRERLAAIGTTAATLAHEIGNPLNGMALNAQLMQRRVAKAGEGLDARFVGYVSNMQHEITRLTNLLQEFRSVSHRQTFTFQPLNLGAVIQELLAVETPNYTDRGVQVEQVMPDDLPHVHADADKLKQVFLNLCKNAVEAMPAGGTLTLRAHAAERVTIEVTDTGDGIPEGVDIFEPFATTKAEGTGLGLPIVQQIVTAHGGTLNYTSTPGQGTTFTVVLPLHPPNAAP